MSKEGKVSRETINPIFNTNRLKLGIFGLNGAGMMTSAEEATSGDWSYSARVSRLADAAGFEAVCPYSRWSGFVEEEPNHPTGIALDCSAWAAGTSQIVEKSAVFTTINVPTMHPIVAVKQTTTIDHLSGGRFGLNVVAGWNKPELEMFGAGMNPHEDRYDQAAEWVEIVRRLWSEQEAFDFEGRYYNIKRGISLPRPIQAPMPPIMNAGGSDRGRHFAAKYADMAFVIINSDDPAQIKAQVEQYRRTAREEYNRDLQVWCHAYTVIRDTEKEAHDFVDYYTIEKGDNAALDGWMRLVGANTKMMSPEKLEAMRYRFKAGNGGVELVGTPSQVVDRLQLLSDCGIDGVFLIGVGIEESIIRWNATVMPLLVQSGLRN